MQYSHEFIRKQTRHKMICFLAVLGVFVFFVLCVVDVVNRIQPEQFEEDIECKPLTLDRNVLHAARVSTMSADEIALKRYFHDLQMTRQVVSMDRQAKHFFARNWEPSYSCSTRLRMGCPGDGGKWICDPHLHLQGDQCVVYSFGSHDEFSFETAVHNFNPHCHIHTFDPTVAHPASRPSFVHYHHWGLGTTDTHNKSMGLYFTLADIMRRLGHDHVDVLKVDCEGCELDFWTLDVPDGTVHQLQVEVHWANRRDTPELVHAFFSFLTRKGFAIFNKESNIQYADGNAVEFALVQV